MFILCHRQNVPCRDHLLQNTLLCQSPGLCGEGTWLQLAHKLLEFSGKVITITMLWKEIKMIHIRKKKRKLQQPQPSVFRQCIKNEILKMKFLLYFISSDVHIYISMCISAWWDSWQYCQNIFNNCATFLFYLHGERASNHWTEK